jgi:urea transport system substrate-binding protein
LQLIVADGQSKSIVFAQQAERLISEEKVSVIFGCWSSRARRAVKTVVEAHQHLLFYPLRYEGLEQSPNIIYTGSVPNQLIIPAARWALNKFGKRVYLIGSDYIFPHTANQIINDFIRITNGQLLAERYIASSEQNINQIMNEIEQLKPDIIMNTIAGNQNLVFFQALARSSQSATPVFSFNLTEQEIYHPQLTLIKNHYLAWSYFQSLANIENRQFVDRYRKQFGRYRVTSDPIEAAYFDVYLWAQAVNEAKSISPDQVNITILRQSYHAPSGIVSIDRKTRHTWKMLRIAQIQPNRQIKIVYSSQYPLRPEPFPGYRHQNDWHKLLTTLINHQK